jgi:hypothetical protein
MTRYSPYKSQNSHRSSLYRNLIQQWKSSKQSTPFSSYIACLEEDTLSVEEILQFEICKTCILCKNGILTDINGSIHCTLCNVFFKLNVISPLSIRFHWKNGLTISILLRNHILLNVQVPLSIIMIGEFEYDYDQHGHALYRHCLVCERIDRIV